MGVNKEFIQQAAAHLFGSYTLPIFEQLDKMPEPSRAEWLTSAFVQGECKKMDVDFKVSATDQLTVFAEVKGLLPCAKPRRYGFKSDLDAIRKEDNSYFHGCFHSGHTAIALSVMKFLQENRNLFDFSIVFVFQSSEEVVEPSGAERLLQSGEFEKLGIEMLMGLHASPELTLGQVAFRTGVAQASVDELRVEIHSPRAAHVQYQQLANPIFALTEVIQSLQKIVAQGNPLQHTLLNWSKFWTSVDPESVNSNKVPTTATAVASFRVFDEQHRDACKGRISSVCKGIEGMYSDLSIRAEFKGNGIKSVLNNKALTEAMKAAAVAYLGDEAVKEAGLRMGGDDFSYYSYEVPSCMFRLGTTSSPEKGFYGLHDEKFSAAPAAMEVGVGLMLYLLLLGKF